LKNIAVILAAVTLMVGAQMTGCSGSGDSESSSEKSVTRKVADEAVKEIRTPLEKARAVKKQEEGRLDKMKKDLKE
jgi:hypothetical protein